MGERKPLPPPPPPENPNPPGSPPPPGSPRDGAPGTVTVALPIIAMYSGGADGSLRRCALGFLASSIQGQVPHPLPPHLTSQPVSLLMVYQYSAASPSPSTLS